MNTVILTFQAAGRYLVNKGAAIVLRVVLMGLFTGLPSESPLPFTELLYVAILIVGCVVAAPLLRLLVFPEAAEYAESRRLREDLEKPARSPALLHYWFATGISYLVTIACLASVSH
jgi:hypothetical protein